MSNYKILVDETGDYPHFYNEAGKHLSIVHRYENGDVLALTEAGDEAMYYAHEFALDEPAQGAAKVAALAENPKHLYFCKFPAYSSSPHRLTGANTAFACRWDCAEFHFRKLWRGRHKSGIKVERGLRHHVFEALDSLLWATRPSMFFEGETIRVPLQSQAIRDGYYHWFPVALENTTYSDAIVRHQGAYYQQGLRATRGFLQDACLYRKYQWWGWQSSAVYGNKAL